MGFKDTIEKAADSVIKTVKETIGVEEKPKQEVSTERSEEFTWETEAEVTGEHPEPLYVSGGEEEEYASHLNEYVGLGFDQDFTKDIANLLSAREDERALRPNIEVWPFEDEFGLWAMSHRDPIRAVVCGTPEFKDSPYCGLGVH
jgi:hypothetical protein